MNHLHQDDFLTLAKGGVPYVKEEPVLKPEFDRMWKRFTALSRHIHNLIEDSQRPFEYEVGKSRNYLQQAGRGRFFYPKFAWVRYIREGDKKNAPSVSMHVAPDGITFSLDYAEKYEKESVIDRDGFSQVVDLSAARLEEHGFERDESKEWPRYKLELGIDDLKLISDSEFDERTRFVLLPLLEVYEAMIMGNEEHEPGEEPQDLKLDEDREKEIVEASGIAKNVAAAALAAARGEHVPQVSNSNEQDSGPRTIVRRRRVLVPEKEAPVERPRKKATTRSVSTADLVYNHLPQRNRGDRNEREAREPRERKEERPLAAPRPMPKQNEPISVVPPAVGDMGPLTGMLQDHTNVLIFGASQVDMYRVCFDSVASLVREQLARPKKRHELILDALKDEEVIDVLALALLDAPRGLSMVALQTHELVVHYFRERGPFLFSLRSTIRDTLLSEIAQKIIVKMQNGNYTLTPDGRLYVDENFRYALQEAAKEKPRRYAVRDFCTFVGVEQGLYPSLYTVHDRKLDHSGAMHTMLVEGPVLKAIQRANRNHKHPHALVLMNATPENLREAFGPLFPLADKANRGRGALAPTINLPEVGPVSIPPNLHIIVAMELNDGGLDTVDSEIHQSFEFLSVSDLPTAEA
jgi:hypothetical protein